MKVALSTSVFEDNLNLLRQSEIPIVELSSHKPDALERIIDHVINEGIEVVSVHSPAPNRKGVHPNLGASEEFFEETYGIILDGFNTAVRVGAKSVTIHPFYDLGGQQALPREDEVKFAFLRGLEMRFSSLPEYIRSDNYLRARDLAERNLRRVMQRLDEDFPSDIELCLENLNPRITYGLQIPSEMVDLAQKINSGRLKLDVDLPHAHLSSNVHGFDILEEMKKISHLVGVVSVCQNHGGKYCIDRRYGEAARRQGLEDVDPHFPLHGKVRMVRSISQSDLGIENRAFKDILEGAVMYDEGGDIPVGTVPIDECLEILKPKILVAEYDQRYAPMNALLKSFALVRQEYGKE